MKMVAVYDASACPLLRSSCCRHTPATTVTPYQSPRFRRYMARRCEQRQPEPDCWNVVSFLCVIFAAAKTVILPVEADVSPALHSIAPQTWHLPTHESVKLLRR